VDLECLVCPKAFADDPLYCGACGGFYCKDCWDKFKGHSPLKNKDGIHKSVFLGSKEDLKQTKAQDQFIFGKRVEETSEEVNAKNIASYWFGLDAKKKQAVVNCDLYTEIILSSEFREKAKQFPSLVSFIGKTGAGKSTLIVGSASIRSYKFANMKKRRHS
jgi:hypothetical protein